MSVLDPDLASGSSRESRFSQRVEMMLSYWLGYLRKMSYTHTAKTEHHTRNPGEKGLHMYMYVCECVKSAHVCMYVCM